MFSSKDLTGLFDDISTTNIAQTVRSLNATFLRNHIVSALRASSDPDVRHAASLIDQNIVYAHPTIVQLAASIASIISTKATGSHNSQQAALIDDFIAKYAANLPIIQPTSEVSKERIVVFLTGSTGSIGSYILAGLLAVIGPRDDVNAHMAATLVRMFLAPHTCNGCPDDGDSPLGTYFNVDRACPARGQSLRGN